MTFLIGDFVLYETWQDHPEDPELGIVTQIEDDMIYVNFTDGDSSDNMGFDISGDGIIPAGDTYADLRHALLAQVHYYIKDGRFG